MDSGNGTQVQWIKKLTMASNMEWHRSRENFNSKLTIE